MGLEAAPSALLCVFQVHQAAAGRGGSADRGLGLASSKPALCAGHHQGVQVSPCPWWRGAELLSGQRQSFCGSPERHQLINPRVVAALKQTQGTGVARKPCFVLSSACCAQHNPLCWDMNPGSRTGPLGRAAAPQAVAAAGRAAEGKYCLAAPRMKPGGCCHPIWSVTHRRTACTIAASSTSSWHTGYLCPTGSLTATR